MPTRENNESNNLNKAWVIIHFLSMCRSAGVAATSLRSFVPREEVYPRRWSSAIAARRHFQRSIERRNGRISHVCFDEVSREMPRGSQRSIPVSGAALGSGNDPWKRTVTNDEAVWCPHLFVTLLSHSFHSMNQTINQLANAVVYGGLLKCGNDQVRDATICLQHHDTYLNDNFGPESWITSK